MAGRKKKAPEEPKGAPAYMLTYGDMMSLLLCFFVLLISMSTMEVEKMQAAAASLKGALSALPFQDRIVPSPMVPKRPVKGLEKRGKRSKALAKLKQVISAQNLQEVVTVVETQQGIHLVIGNPALFDTGRAEIKPEFAPFLKQAVEVVYTGSETFRVEGHTDNVPIHNPQFEDNWELSIARSLSVIRFIRSQVDIDPARLRPVGCGEFHPVASNDKEEGRSQNRRVEIFIEMED